MISQLGVSTGVANLRPQGGKKAYVINHIRKIILHMHGYKLCEKLWDDGFSFPWALINI